MANKIFKGFMQVTEGSFEAQTGYIYFVRNSANTGHTDGYLQFNGKKYGTAAEVAADLEAKIGTLPQGYDNLVAYVNDQISAVTGNFSSEEVSGISNGVEVHIGQADGNVTSVTVTAPDFANTYAGKSDFEAVSGAVDTIQNDYLTSDDETAIYQAISAETTAREAIEAELEALSASTRLTELEASAHTHDNKTVLDGITAQQVQAWDDMAAGAAVVLSAYTGSDAGLTAGYLKTYEIFQGGNSVGKIDIPKDLVVSSGQIVEENGVKYLRLTIANSSTPVDIAVSDLVDAYTGSDTIDISTGNTVSVKVVEANGLYTDSNGINVALASADSAGTMSSSDFEKLGTIEASAQTNVIEEIKVDGTALTVDNKSVNIDLSGKADNATVGTLSGRVDALEAVSAGTRLGTIEAISADTRLDALEELTGATHTHDNKSVLDGISAEDVTAWDDAEQNAKDYADGLKNALNADVSGDSNGVEVRVQQVSGVVTDVTVTAPDFANTYAPIGVTSADTRLNVLETSAATKTEVGTLSGRVDTLEAVSADTRLDALEALTASTNSALQSISAADASVSVGTKTNNNQTVGVALSSTANNALSLENDGLFAAIYYDGDDSN